MGRKKRGDVGYRFINNSSKIDTYISYRDLYDLQAKFGPPLDDVKKVFDCVRCGKQVGRHRVVREVNFFRSAKKNYKDQRTWCSHQCYMETVNGRNDGSTCKVKQKIRRLRKKRQTKVIKQQIKDLEESLC